MLKLLRRARQRTRVSGANGVEQTVLTEEGSEMEKRREGADVGRRMSCRIQELSNFSCESLCERRASAGDADHRRTPETHGRSHGKPRSCRQSHVFALRRRRRSMQRPLGASASSTNQQHLAVSEGDGAHVEVRRRLVEHRSESSLQLLARRGR